MFKRASFKGLSISSTYSLVPKRKTNLKLKRKLRQLVLGLYKLFNSPLNFVRQKYILFTKKKELDFLEGILLILKIYNSVTSLNFSDFNFLRYTLKCFYMFFYCNRFQYRESRQKVNRTNIQVFFKRKRSNFLFYYFNLKNVYYLYSLGYFKPVFRISRNRKRNKKLYRNFVKKCYHIFLRSFFPEYVIISKKKLMNPKICNFFNRLKKKMYTKLKYKLNRKQFGTKCLFMDRFGREVNKMIKFYIDRTIYFFFQFYSSFLLKLRFNWRYKMKRPLIVLKYIFGKLSGKGPLRTAHHFRQSIWFFFLKRFIKTLIRISNIKKIKKNRYYLLYKKTRLFFRFFKFFFYKLKTKFNYLVFYKSLL